jgi:hypothetical protein
MSKALNLLKSSKTLEQRANEVIERIKKDTELSYIDFLQRKLDNIKDQIADLSNFSLETNINKGQMALSIEESKKRFLTILELEYQYRLTEKELEVKTVIFNDYFNAASVETK